MVWWWISMGSLTAACMALVPVYNRRRARRARLDEIRAQVEASLSALKQPDGTSLSNPPTESSPLPPTEDCAVRPRTRVVLSDLSLLSDTLAPGWRFR